MKNQLIKSMYIRLSGDKTLIKILLVDDESAFLDLSKTFLELYNPNTKIDVADSANTALLKLRSEAYDVIISDYAMPGMDGLALLDKIRDLEIEVPFIMFSGMGKEEVLQEAFENDMTFYFQKKGDPETRLLELSQRIRRILENKRADELLHISFLALDNSSEAICWLDRNSCFIYVNSAATELLGFSQAELLDMSLKDLDGDFKLEHWHYYWKELQRDKHLTMEFFVRRKDGSEIPLKIKSSYTEYAGKEYNCAFLHDISERKVKEKELNLSQFSINNTPDAIFWITKAGEFIYVNDSACELLGYSKQEFLNLRFDTIEPGVKGEEWAKLWNVVKKNKYCTIESYYSSRDGNSIPVESKLSYLSYANKEYLCVFSRDISQRLQADAELRASEERMNLAIRGAHIGAWDWNILTDEFVISRDWQEMLGYSPQEFGSTFEEVKQNIFHPEEIGYVGRDLQEHLKGKTSLYKAEHRLRRRDGSWVWILNYGEVVARDEKGRPLRMSGIHLDITEMRSNREALRRANKKINLLSSINRHDIQNQVSIATGYLSLLQKLPLDKSIRDDYLLRTSTAVNNIQSQISFARDYQNLGVKSAEWQKVETVVNLAAKDFLLEGVSLEVTTNGLEIYADPMLEKVFYNLMDNSKKHGGNVTHIRFSFREKENACILSYEDDGAGIPVSLKEKIFENEFGRNTGYGLFLIKEVLDITGISIKETGVEGSGACFEFEVPKRYYRVSTTLPSSGFPGTSFC